MVDALNMLLLKKHESIPSAEVGEHIDHWLKTRRNYERLQHECEKIWNRSSHDPGYDAERAFRVLGRRLAGVCRQETLYLLTENRLTR